MEVRYGSVWAEVGAFRTPTYSEPSLEQFFSTRLRRGARGGRGGLATRRMVAHPASLRRREERRRQHGVEEEEGSDSGSSVTSDIGSFLGFMEIE